MRGARARPGGKPADFTLCIQPGKLDIDWAPGSEDSQHFLPKDEGMFDMAAIESAFDEVCERLKAILYQANEVDGVVESILVNIDNLKMRFRVCMKLNQMCLDALIDPFGVHYDPETETFYGLVDGKRKPMLKINRADPAVPITISKTQKLAAFVPSVSTQNPMLTPEGAEALRNLAFELQAFYYAASKVWDQIEQEFIGKKSSKFIGVKLVRNKLFEHAVKGEQNSFGVSGNVGPTVKPMRYAKTKDEAPYDQGLLPNVEEFLRHCSERISTFAR